MTNYNSHYPLGKADSLKKYDTALNICRQGLGNLEDGKVEEASGKGNVLFRLGFVFFFLEGIWGGNTFIGAIRQKQPEGFLAKEEMNERMRTKGKDRSRLMEQAAGLQMEWRESTSGARSREGGMCKRLGMQCEEIREQTGRVNRNSMQFLTPLNKIQNIWLRQK